MEGHQRESRLRFTPCILQSSRLVPFVASCGLYFFLWLPKDKPSWYSALGKCLPILYLALFVHKYGSSGSYGRFIWIGLLCSALGDFVLTWTNQFYTGMTIFALAQLFYIRALGFFPLRQVILESVVVVFLLYFCILQPHLSFKMQFPVLVYLTVLALLLWRALAQERCAAIGGLFFSISHAILAWNTFVRPLPSGHLISMVTYYSAQALLALSTVEDEGPRLS